MKRGKQICNTLKEIRLRVARENGIPYEPSECHHEGDCLGTCPKCEQEVRYLEQQIGHIRRLGKKVAVVGIGASVAALSASCRHPVGDVERLQVLSDDVPNATTSGAVPSKNHVHTSDSLDHPKSAFVQTDTIREPVLLGDVVDESPRFHGGYEALIKFLSDNVKYPPECMKDSIEGRVAVSFMVEEDGTVTEPSVVKAVHPLLDAEALRVVGLMPKWQPGMRSGKRIRMGYTLPVNFKLKE